MLWCEFHFSYGRYFIQISKVVKRILENIPRRINKKTKLLPRVTKYSIINSNTEIIEFFAAKGQIFRISSTFSAQNNVSIHEISD